MKSAFFVCLLIFQISYGQHSVCHSNDPPTLIKISEIQAKNNHSYQFNILNYANPALIHRNQNGTFFMGNFSKISLFGDKKSHDYQSTGFSFKYPPQHRIAQVNNEMIQLQIKYQLKSPQLSTWKHKTIYLSVSFFLAEYAPEDKLTLGKQINKQLRNSSVIDLKALLPLISSLNMYLYKGLHSDNPADRACLWLIRKELLLMNFDEFQMLKELIFSEVRREQMRYNGILERISDIHEIQQNLITVQAKFQQF